MIRGCDCQSFICYKKCIWIVLITYLKRSAEELGRDLGVGLE